MAKPFNIPINAKAIVETMKEIQTINRDIQREEILKAPLSKLIMHPDNEYIYQNSENKERIEELAEDIKENGLLTPLLVTKTQDDKYIIFAGNTRYLACESINYEPIDIIVRDYDDFTIRRSLISSNNNREKTALQKANEINYLKNLYNEYKKNYPQYLKGKSVTEKIAEDLKVDIATVQRADRLNRVEPEIKEAINQNNISATSAQRLADIDSNTQKEIAKIIKNDNKVVTKEDTQKIVETNKKYEQEIKKLNEKMKKNEKKDHAKNQDEIDTLNSTIRNLKKQKTTEIIKIIKIEKANIDYLISSIEHSSTKIIKDFDFLKSELESEEEKQKYNSLINALLVNLNDYIIL